MENKKSCKNCIWYIDSEAYLSKKDELVTGITGCSNIEVKLTYGESLENFWCSFYKRERRRSEMSVFNTIGISLIVIAVALIFVTIQEKGKIVYVPRIVMQLTNLSQIVVLIVFGTYLITKSY